MSDLIIDATIDENGRAVENEGVITSMSKAPEAEKITVRSLESLPQERRKAVLDFVPKININDEMTVLSYGDKPLEDLAKIASESIQSAKGTEEEKVIKEKLLLCVDETAKINVHKKGFLARFFENTKKYNNILPAYKSLNETLNDFDKAVGEKIELLFKNLNETKEFKENNEELVHNLEDYLVAGQLALEAAEAKLEELDNMDNTLYNDKLESAKEYISTFASRLNDLELSRATTFGIIQASKVVHKSSYDNIKILKKIKSNTIPFLRQICALALMNERNKSSRCLGEELTKGTEKLSIELAKDIKSEALKIAQKSNEGFLDPAVAEVFLDEVRNTMLEVLEINTESSSAISARLDGLREAELLYKKALTDSTADTKHITSSSLPQKSKLSSKLVV